ncbi:MAG: sigma-70 family RNA polymerase sigma factor [Planctomycetes bacterium]|nr:sigma-70 family RNA polymerase sigma factor [Planctomycetota bacterium]
MERTLAGDREAFRQIVLRHQGFLAQICRRQTGDPTATEDLVQETFLRAYQRLRSYEPRYRLSTWLARIALNAARDHGRRSQVREAALDRVALPQESPSPLDLASSRETSRRVEAALAGLPTQQREVLVLTLWGGCTQREAAQALQLPLGTVKSRQRAALSKLRALVAPLAEHTDSLAEHTDSLAEHTEWRGVP